MSRRRRIAIVAVLAAMGVWTALWLYFSAIQGVPDVAGELGERYREEAERGRLILSGIWLAGMAAAVAILVSLWRYGRRD